MRQGHKMRDGSKRAEKNAERVARRRAGKTSRGWPTAFSGMDLDRIKDGLRSAVARRFPESERSEFERKNRKVREARPRPDCPHVKDAPKKSKAPRGFLPPGRPTWLVGRRALQSIRGQ